MNRFFLDPHHISEEFVHFPPDIAHQIVNVLRLEGGKFVEVFDDQGGVYLVSLEIDGETKQVSGKILRSQPIKSKPRVIVSLYFGLSSREKVELILQKGTEIGVSHFYPFISSRTLIQTISLPEKKVLRWERIIREAAEQSGRIWLPELHKPMDLDHSFKTARLTHDVCLIAWEQADNHEDPLHRYLSKWKAEKIALFVGSEGGFSEDEINVAEAQGIKVVSLGKGILRMETAAIVFPVLVLYELGQL
jgi:16S rRNA (uracil1498-N3)-methyltransferase